MSRRVMVLAAAIVFACCACVGGGVQAQSGQTAPATEKKAEEQFKNIQTLKGIPADQLIPTMQFIAASLGVECEFCHVQNAFDKDDKKPKQTARKMMEMMFAINKNNFNGQREVTCYSCHRGNTDPVAIPAVMTEAEAMNGAKKPEGEAKSAGESSGPSADQLIDKFVQASGGAAALGKVTSRVMKGKIEVGAMSLPIDVYTKDPDKRVSFTHMQDGDNITAFDGHEGWMGSPNRPVREMHGGDIDGASIDADLQLPIHLEQMFIDLKVRGTEKIGDHDAYVVVGQREGKPPIRLYFDEQSGLLVRMLRFGETALGRMPTQIDYADYRDASGVKIPYQWTLARPSGRFTIQLSEVQTNVPVDDAKFAKPPAPTGPPKGPAQ